MSRHQGVIFVCFTLLALTSCVSPEAHQQMREANDDLRAQAAHQSGYIRELEGERDRLRADVERLGKNAADAEYVSKQKDELDRLLKELQERGASGIPGVNVIQTPEGVAFQVQRQILFASWQVIITGPGQEVLAQRVSPLQ